MRSISRAAAPRYGFWDATSGRKLRELDPGVDRGQCKAALSPDGKTFCLVARRPYARGGGIWLPGRSGEGSTPGSMRRTLAGVWESRSRPMERRSRPNGSTIWSISGTLRLESPFFPRTRRTIPRSRLRSLPMATWSPPAMTGGIFASGIRPWGRSSTGSSWAESGASGLLPASHPDRRSLAAAGEYFDRLSGFPGHCPHLGHPWLLGPPSAAVGRPRPCASEYSPDGRRLAVASWNAEDRQPPAVKAGRETHDNEIDLFDASTGKRLFGLLGHNGRIHALAFSSDGMTLVSAGEDDAIRFWDLAVARQARGDPRSKGIPKVQGRVHAGCPHQSRGRRYRRISRRPSRAACVR